MKLRELSDRTGAPVTSIKFWIREAILPAGALRNQTTAVYDDAHIERIELILTLRDSFGLPVTRIRELTSLIDDPAVPLLDVMEHCQLVATGLSAEGAGAARASGHAAQVDAMVRSVGWPDASSVARDALAVALHDAGSAGVSFDADLLLQHAEALSTIAGADIVSIRTDGSRDTVARNLLLGATAQNRVFNAMNQLAHTSAAIASRS